MPGVNSGSTAGVAADKQAGVRSDIDWPPGFDLQMQLAPDLSKWLETRPRCGCAQLALPGFAVSRIQDKGQRSH
jgi:hypothetical protein